MLGAAFFFSVMAVLVKLVPRIPAQEKVFVRSALNVAFTLVLLRRYGVSALGQNVRTLLLRGALGYVALSCHFFALGAMPLADALVLQNTSPLVVALIGPAVLGERSGPRTVALALAGLAGVALVLRPEGRIAPGPGLIAFAGGISSALAYMTIRSIGRREHPLTVVLYFPMVSCVASLVPTVRGFVAPGPLEALTLVGIGVATTIAQIMITAGLQLERAAIATPVSYTGIIFGAIFGAALFGERLDGWTAAGAVVIMAAAVLIARQKEATADH